MYQIALIHDGPLPARLQAALDAQARITASCQPGSNTDGANTFSDVDALLADQSTPDLVWIHTRTGYHAEYIIKALQAGKDVVCNAPLCITSSAAWQILETAKYTRRKLWVAGAPCRFWQQLGEEAGTITRLHVWARQHRNDDGTVFPDGGLLYTYFYGFAEALATLVGPIESVSGSLESSAAADGLERSGHAELEFGNGHTGFVDWTAMASDEQLPVGFSITLESNNGEISVTGDFADDGTLQLKEVKAQGSRLEDPGPGRPLSELVDAILRREEVAEWNAFRALRVVEFIDRLYTRIRK
jgi:UDP-N-acetyl-2-amino-2-deoxyglucuronate dehydrogenase